MIAGGCVIIAVSRFRQWVVGAQAKPRSENLATVRRYPRQPKAYSADRFFTSTSREYSYRILHSQRQHYIVPLTVFSLGRVAEDRLAFDLAEFESFAGSLPTPLTLF